MPEAFADLSTPLVADACVRCGIPLFVAAEHAEQVLVAAHQIWQTERD